VTETETTTSTEELSWVDQVLLGNIDISLILTIIISGGIIIVLIIYLNKNPQILNAIKKSKK